MQAARTTRYRIELIDVARGIALIAMAIYHFTWDLDFFGYIEPGTSVTGGWRIFARCIAASFLFLVGIGLYLAHGETLRTRAFLRRLAVIATAAAAITAVTFYATPNAFIFFGILHNIAVASVLGLLFLKLPVAVTVAAAIIVAAAPHFVYAPFLDHPAFWWTGLSRNVPESNDYIPLFPWFSAVLAGIAAAKAAARAGLLARLGRFEPARKIPLLAATGRYSLGFYLLHQPVLFSSVWLFAQIVPPPAPDQGALFLQACSAECTVQREQAFCRAYCGCLLEEIAAQDRLGDLYDPQRPPQVQSWLEDVAFRCTVKNNG